MNSQKPERSTPVSQDAVRMGSYTYRAPSPPTLYVPPPIYPSRTVDGDVSARIVPLYENIDSSLLSREEYDIITRGLAQIPRDRSASWRYTERRNAQPILDFLYLGPTSIVRDQEFLQKQGITMILVARDARMAVSPLISVEQAGSALGIATHYVDYHAPHNMVSTFPEIIRLINHHMLAVHHAQAARHGNEQRGKVLVACETGNARSAAVVTAYIMSMYGKPAVPAIQYVTMQRFCCVFEEDAKRALQTWDDLMRARWLVSMNKFTFDQDSELAISNTATKRRIGFATDANDVEDQMMNDDHDRFDDRQDFAPFRDL